VQLLDPRHDWPRVGPALEEAFMDHWGSINDQAQKADGGDDENASENEDETDNEGEDDLYFNSNGLCFVAMVGDEVAGSCLCNARTIEWPASGKVGSLSIRRPFRRRGIARALLLHAFGEFYRRGVRRAITDTDGASFTGANQLYIQAGMRVFRYEETYEKTIRPGRELRTLSTDDLGRL
jgi:ribosomal protein S18 acetylase RimI-like enzyme